ncbi:hypothetical protein [Iamia sp.]|uniref:hypothetical protein n=1 Tax=Iamia sp. TaxID=2722710 RepID=UPI002B53FC8D|nr:hypothetical protein [Iamia sp.]HXH57544.1 hypothetical protein [Iamia sp.]
MTPPAETPDRGDETPTTRGRNRRLDPQGRRALFEMPVDAARDTIRSGDAKEGKDALYSTGPRQAGSAVVECGGCQVRTRVSLTDVAMRLATLSVWVPGRRRGHWMRCPACEQRHWCSVAWNE